jgi:hypothetical protein
MSTSSSETQGTLSTMTEEQFRRMEHLLIEAYPPVSYRDVQRLLHQEFSITVSIGALAAHYHRITREQMLERTAATGRTVEAFQQQVGGRSMKLFETLMEFGALSALEPRYLAENPSREQIREMIMFGVIDLKAQTQVAKLRLQERAQALREMKYRDKHPQEDPAPATLELPAAAAMPVNEPLPE